MMSESAPEPSEIRTVEEEGLVAEATAEDSAIRELYVNLGRGWMELGVRLCRVQEKRLFTYLGYTSFIGWMETSAGIPRETGYGYIRVIQALRDIPREELAKFRSKQNAMAMRKLGESQRTPEMIQKAQTMPEQTFAAEVRSQLTGAQLEVMVRRVLLLPETLAATFDRAMRIAKWSEGTERFEEAFEFILSEFLLEYGPVYESYQEQHGLPAHTN